MPKIEIYASNMTYTQSTTTGPIEFHVQGQPVHVQSIAPTTNTTTTATMPWNYTYTYTVTYVYCARHPDNENAECEACLWEKLGGTS